MMMMKTMATMMTTRDNHERDVHDGGDDDGDDDDNDDDDGDDDDDDDDDDVDDDVEESAPFSYTYHNLKMSVFVTFEKSAPFLQKVHSAPVHFFMIFKKVILIRKNDRLPRAFIADSCFLAATDVFSCDHRFAQRFPFRPASALLKSDLNLATTRKRRRFCFLAVLVSRGEVSDFSRNIANSGLSKGGLGAKRELNCYRPCKNNPTLDRKNDHSGQRLGPKNVHATAATKPLRRLSLSYCADFAAFLFLRHIWRLSDNQKTCFGLGF